MNIDLKIVPFSAPGAYLCVSELTREVWGDRAPGDGLWIRIAHGSASGIGLVAKIELALSGAPVPYTWEATPWCLTLSAQGTRVRLAFDAHNRLVFAGEGAELALIIPPGVGEEFLRYDENLFDINSMACRARFMFAREQGTLTLSDPGLEETRQPKVVRMSGPKWALSLEDYTWVYAPTPTAFDIDQCIAARRAAFEAYADAATAGIPERFKAAAMQAAYVNHSAIVNPRGLYEAPVMLMSKNWMKNVWTWDSAFNAVASAGRDDEAAWNNLISPFRRQHESGRLLDLVNEHTWIDNYTKPPIHGWALSKLRAAGSMTDARRAWIYPRLLKWVNSWYETMDWDHDGVCQYNHGNDSGWDNCTNFRCGAPIEGPDLSAYLVLCWDELSILAEELGRPDEAAEHRARGDAQLSALLSHCWDGARFRVLQSGSHNEQDGVDSLFPFLPILLGDRLPKDVFDKLAAGLKQEGRFLTPYGLATESVASAHYISDGYWMGPIWAPPMMFIIEGLKKGGEVAFAAELADRFLKMCEKSGFAENFNAQTGAGLRDRAYTWTSSIFLILARDYLL